MSTLLDTRCRSEIAREEERTYVFLRQFTHRFAELGTIGSPRMGMRRLESVRKVMPFKLTTIGTKYSMYSRSWYEIHDFVLAFGCV
jgi:hypothetical protein